jgi:lysylphosphatidylglycerol synthetase-like protein (DUF2156 family)
MENVVSRRWVLALTGLAAITAVMTAGSSVISTTVIREDGSSRVVEGTSYQPFGLVLLGLMAITVVLAVVACVLYIRGRRKASERLLIAAGVTGLIGIVPGALAFLALLVEKKTNKAR